MTTPTSSVTLVEVAEQEVLNHGFEIKQIPGRGRGIVATKEFDVGEQIMFISKPFDLCVTSAALAGQLSRLVASVLGLTPTT